MRYLLSSFLVFSFALTCISDVTPPKFTDVNASISWLTQTSTKMIRDSRREMPNGMAAFPPQEGIGYEAFWLRDYLYMLEGNIDAFSDKELKDACRFFIKGIREDGAGVDCIKFDGTPIYKPGFGSMGENPVADGSQFTVAVAYYTWRKTKDDKLLSEIIDPLVKTMRACPRNPKTGLVHIDPSKEYDRCPYGFTDTVRKTGDLLFSSLLFVQSARYMDQMLNAVDRKSDAAYWSNESKKVEKKILETFWDEKTGLFRAATVQCKEHDIWGSAYAVYLDVANQTQSERIAQYFKQHYNQLVQKGQLRHNPGGVYWEVARERDNYQNGGFWATPMGWFIYTLDYVDSEMADQAILDLANGMREQNLPEWVFGDRIQLPRYNASASLPLAGIREMIIRRRNVK